MARYMVRKSYVQVVGEIWMPNTTAAYTYPVDSHDVESMRDDDGKITRDSVEQWLTSHSGDFRSVIDFAASIEDGDTSIDIPWSDEDNGMTFHDCTFGDQE